MRLAAVALLAGLLAAPAAADNPARRHRPADMALARKALLGDADVGAGWRSGAVSTRPASLTCPAFDPPLAGVVETGTASRELRAGAQGVSQSVWVFRTREEASVLWRRVVGKGLLRCLVAAARSAGGLAVTSLLSGELAVPRLAERTRAFRVVVTARVGGQTVRLYVDTLLLARGRAVTELTFGSGQPIPSAVELLLGRTVARRLALPGSA